MHARLASLLIATAAVAAVAACRRDEPHPAAPTAERSAGPLDAQPDAPPSTMSIHLEVHALGPDGGAPPCAPPQRMLAVDVVDGGHEARVTFGWPGSGATVQLIDLESGGVRHVQAPEAEEVDAGEQPVLRADQLEATDAGLRACKGPSDCRVVKPIGYSSAEFSSPYRATLSPDGRKVAVVRTDGTKLEGLRARLETYDVASSRRLTSVGAGLNEIVSGPVWVDGGILLTACVCCGPGCGLHFIDPATGRHHAIGGNAANVINGVGRLDGSTWFVVGETGSWYAHVIDMRTGRELRKVALPGTPDGMTSLGVAKHPSGDLILAYDVAEARVVRFDLANARVRASYPLLPQPCYR